MYYGWVILAIAMLSAFLGAGLNNVSMAVVLKPLSEDQGWPRTLTAGAVTTGALLAGLIAPWVGRLADRVGSRVLVPLGAVLVGILAALLSRTHAPWQFYAAYVPARALGDTLLSGVVPMTAVTNWFQAKRPRVQGLVFMSVPLGSAGLALLYQQLITHFDWRAAFLALGGLLWGLAVVPAAVLLRRQPEDLGLLPDGAAPGARVATGEAERVAAGEAERAAGAAGRVVAGKAQPAGVAPVGDGRSWQLGEATRTPTLWLIVASSMLATVATGGMAFHLVAYYTDLAIAPGVAASALGLLALAGAAGSTLWGLASERVPPRYVGTAVLLASALSALLLLQVRTPALAYAGALLFGLTARGGLVLTQVLLARYYGRRSFGAISGFADPFGKVGLGGGPLIAAAAFDLTGSYDAVFLGFTAAFMLAAGLVYCARPPAPVA
ncbi:MAG TPA: MFS transporter [Chloroflexota bacterium]|jgi:MFS family permease